MHKKDRRFFASLCLFVTLLVFLAALFWRGRTKTSSPSSVTSSIVAEPTRPPSDFVTVDPSAYAGLYDPATSPLRDLNMVASMLENFFVSFLGQAPRPPLGSNQEITAALTGRNAQDLVFFPPDHPGINPAGELCDRWGTPYLFHPLSADHFEIRSAGPDRDLFTADDLLSP